MDQPVFRSRIFIARDHPDFDGHFPGYPVFPAVSQIDLVVDLLAEELGSPVKSRVVRRAKFRAMLLPESMVDLELTLLAKDRVRWLLRSDSNIYSQGELEFSLETRP